MRASVHPRLMDQLAPSFFPSSATIEANTPTRTASGAETPAWAALEGHGRIPAAVGAMRFTRTGESRLAELTLAQSTHRIALAGAYPAIGPEHRAVVTGPHAGTYDISRVDADSQSGMTVLEARIVSPVAQVGV